MPLDIRKCELCQGSYPKSKMALRHRKGRKPTIMRLCIECRNTRLRKLFKENENAEKKRRRKNTRWYVWEYKKHNPCVDCGEPDPIVLEFDHLRDKKFTISKYRGGTMEALKLEIAKCEVVCANCHRRRTAIRAAGACDAVMRRVIAG